MGKRRDWSKIGEVVEKIRELGLTYKEGSERFGVKVRDRYCYNQRLKRAEAKVNGEETESLGRGESEGAGRMVRPGCPRRSRS